MRKISSIVVHCSDSDNKKHNHKIIEEWHVKERGFNSIGYHYIIEWGGQIRIGREIWKAGAHVRGQNSYSIGVCLTAKNFFHLEQIDSLIKLLNNLLYIFNLKTSDVYGHYELDKAKTCPNLIMEHIRNKLLKD